MVLVLQTIMTLSLRYCDCVIFLFRFMDIIKFKYHNRCTGA